MGETIIIGAILTGRSRPLGTSGRPSAIDKRECAGRVEAGASGLTGDEQADRRHHGGTDKAVHHYPREHYDAWLRELPESCRTLLGRPGAFGENLSTIGLDEASVCIGDIWQAGSALLQVTQARQPCWKLNLRFGVADMARRVQDSLRTGWYYRVLRAGTIGAGDALVLVERPGPEWSLQRVLRLLYVDRMNLPALAALAALPGLSDSWRQLAERRLQTGMVEGWSARLGERAESD